MIVAVGELVRAALIELTATAASRLTNINEHGAIRLRNTNGRPSW
jgi:hypothetical protein